jgi:hypothetical protein
LRVPGVNAAGGKLWLCPVNEDGVLETEPGCLELRDGPHAGYAIAAFRDECVHALTALSPDRVVILDMEPGGRVRKVADILTRSTTGDAARVVCSRRASDLRPARPRNAPLPAGPAPHGWDRRPRD